MPYRRVPPLPSAALALVLSLAVLLGCQTVQLALVQARTALATEAAPRAQGDAHAGHRADAATAEVDEAQPHRAGDHTAHGSRLPGHCPGGGCEVLRNAADAVPAPFQMPLHAIFAPAPPAARGGLPVLAGKTFGGRHPPPPAASPVSLSVVIRI